MIEFEGTVENIVYNNESNGYTVARVKKGRDTVTIVGYLPLLNEGQTVRISGDWVNHPEYGQQLKVESFNEVMPTTLAGIEKYLGSGFIEGIGPVTAKRLVDKFGADTLDIIEYNPERLSEVEGIGEKKAQAIAAAYEEQRELRNVMVFLQTYGISPGNSIKIFKKYGQETIRLIKENPYKLTEDVYGIGFKTADKIAQSLGVERTSKYRLMAGIKYLLTEYSGGGHTFLPSEILTEKCVELLGVDSELIEDACVSLAINKEIIIENMGSVTGVYLMPFYYSELGVSKRILELLSKNKTGLSADVDSEIKKYESDMGIELAPQQREAIRLCIEKGVAIITGGPGTGKTTIIKCIINIMEKNNMKVSLCAPTGRAAKRMSQATGREAKTIHRLLEMGYGDDSDDMTFLKDESDPIECDAVIIDEASMVDIILMNHLLKAIVPGTRFIIVGDVDQLPSVGPGNVLRDLIDSGVVPYIRLTEIFRQSGESLIVVNAHRINSGELPYLNEKDKDFFFLNAPSQEASLNMILDLVKNRLPQFRESSLSPQKYIQVLTPMRKGICGVYNLNNKLQEILNPPSPDKDEKKVREYVLRTGDKVMQIKNNYKMKWEKIDGCGEDEGMGVFNGDMGYIEYIDNENDELSIIYDEDKRIVYSFTDLDEVELAYAVTIHKSQGSEFQVVVMPAVWGPPMLMTRNLLYTGVTRARELVVIAGSRQVLYEMVNNNRIARRYSGLKYRIGKLLDSGIFKIS